ncbi:MAG: response regulator [Bacteroidales bacterium]|nr:response regulator [Bacteroidales bacterium]
MSWKDKTVLIAEDEDSNYLYLEAVLQKAGANVLWARSGQEAIEHCNKNPNIDLILMDLQMPNTNGYDAREIIKKKFPDIPQVAQTAFAMADDEKQALDAGFDDYISKPIRKNNLLYLVEQFLGSRE